MRWSITRGIQIRADVGRSITHRAITGRYSSPGYLNLLGLES